MVPTKSSANSHLYLFELTDQLAIGHFFFFRLGTIPISTYFTLIIIMRINPTSSSPAVSTLEEQNLGRIAQIIGPVLDVVFPPGKMPNIYNALVVKGRDTVGQQINVTCEVQQLLGNNRVRAVAMSATDGLMRGMEVIDT